MDWLKERFLEQIGKSYKRASRGAKFSPETFSQAQQKFICLFLEDTSRPDRTPQGRQLTKVARKETKWKARNA